MGLKNLWIPSFVEIDKVLMVYPWRAEARNKIDHSSCYHFRVKRVERLESLIVLLIYIISIVQRYKYKNTSK